MKRSTLLILIQFLFLYAFTNPVYNPYVYLDHFSYDNEGHWEIELYRFYGEIDSILLSSSSHKKVLYDTFDDTAVELTINEEFIGVSDFINPDGDSIYIICYSKQIDHPETDACDIIVFGDYKNAILPKPEAGQSIVRIYTDLMGTKYYALANSHKGTIGEIKGIVYDKNNEPINGFYFSVCKYLAGIKTDEGSSYIINGTDVINNGAYSFNLHSMRYSFSTINILTKVNVSYFDPPYNYINKDTVSIKPVVFTVFPDSTQTVDIHLLEDVVSNKEVMSENKENIFTINNPSSGELAYNMSIPVISSEPSLIIYNMAGNMVFQTKIHSVQNTIDLPSNITDGTYIVSLNINHKTYSSSKLIIKR